MKILVDVNLSPDWIHVLIEAGFDAIHWMSVGDPRAKDREIMDWARSNGYLVFTHDLDFGALLALTRASGPSVLQVRAQDIHPESLGELVLDVLHDHEDALAAGAIVSVDQRASRVRILPIKP